MMEKKPDKRRRLPDSVLNELRVLLDAFRLLYTDISRPLSSRVYASDASEDGAGLVYVDLSACVSWRFKPNIAEKRCRKGWYTTLQSRPELDSEFIACAEKPSSLKLKVSKKFESKKFETAIRSLKFKTAVRSKWKWS